MSFIDDESDNGEREFLEWLRTPQRQSVSYYSNKPTVQGIKNEIKQLSPGELEQLLRELMEEGIV